MAITDGDIRSVLYYEGARGDVGSWSGWTPEAKEEFRKKYPGFVYALELRDTANDLIKSSLLAMEKDI